MYASPRSDLAPADPHRGRAALNPAGSTINTAWPASAISSTTSPSPRSIAIGNDSRGGDFGQLEEEFAEPLAVVCDQPPAKHRAAVVDDAHPVMRRSPVPSANHADLQSSVVAGVGPTVGSSLFGPLGAGLSCR